MKTTYLLILLMFLSPFGLVFAQNGSSDDDDDDATAAVEGVNCENGWCWGEDIDAAKEKYVLYNDNFKTKNYKEAIGPMEWLLEKTPVLNKSIYINAIKLYSELEKEATEEDKKHHYQDKVLEMYDLRVKYFGQEAYVSNRKGPEIYNFIYKSRGDKDAFFGYYDYFQRIMELNGDETSFTNLTLLMLISTNKKAKNEITQDEILDIYDKISTIMDNNIAKAEGKYKPVWEKSKEGVEGMLAQVITIDCEFVRNNFAEKMLANPDDIKMSKKVLRYLLQGKCTDDPLFLTSAMLVYKAEPEATLASVIATRYQINEDYDSAMVWIKKSIELYGENPEKQAELNYKIARMKQSQNKYSEARTHALEAVKLDNNIASDAYTLIADLYMSSGKLCPESNPVKSRAIYLAAYDMYARAGNSKGMGSAQAQFPAMTDIHSLGMSEGQSLDVGCWIGGSTSLRKRPSE